MKNNTFSIFDFNAVIRHSFNSGRDPEAVMVEGKSVNTPGYAISVLLDRYILPILNVTPLNNLIVSHDSGEEYRKGRDENYKAARRARKPSPDMPNIHEAMRLAKVLFTALGVPQASLSGEESDDILAYLAMNLPGYKDIYTTDGDIVALSQYENVDVYLKLEHQPKFKKGELEVEPKHVTLFKSLCGDTSDGYIGVKGFGEAKWGEFNPSQLEFLDKVVTNYTDPKWVDQFQIACGRSASKPLKIIKENWSQWVHSYHDMAKFHPELVDSKVVDRWAFDDNENCYPIYANKYKRLEWVKRVPNLELLTQVLTETGNLHYLDRLKPLMPIQTLVTRDMLTAERLEEIKKQFVASRFISLDWETYQGNNHEFPKGYVDAYGSIISGMGITCGFNLQHTYYFQFDHADTENNIDKKYLLELLDAIPSEMPVVAQNFYFEAIVLQSEFGVALPIMYDTKVMSTHIDELHKDGNGLKSLSKRYLGENQLHYADVIEKDKTMKDYSGQHVFKYGADDPLVTAHLFDLFYIQLNLEGTWKFVRDNEFPAVQLLAEAHCDGVSLDLEALEAQRDEDTKLRDESMAQVKAILSQQTVSFGRRLLAAEVWYKEDINPSVARIPYENLDQEIKDKIMILAEEFEYRELVEELPTGRKTKSTWVGTELNINSPKQLQYLLYGILGLPIRIRDLKVSESRKAKGLPGTPQTNEDAVTTALFEKDAVEGDWQYDVLNCYLNAKKADTRIKLYYSKLPIWIHEKDGNIHPGINSVGTESRRPTGGSPNLFQLSKKSEGIKVRRAFIPNQRKGHDLIVAIDFDGQELRAMAALSGDENLTACYVGENLKDAHGLVAAQILDIPYELFAQRHKGADKVIAKEYDTVRKMAKGVNFASAYGCGSLKLARMLKIDEDVAKSYLEAKKATYSRLEAWKDEVKAEVQDNGMVATKYGSRKHLYNYYANSSKEMKSYYERSSVNYLVQSLCADYLKVVLAELYKSKAFPRHNASFFCPLYDEIIFSCHSSQAASLIHEVCAVMTKGIKGLDMPFLVNPSLGVNFGDQIEVLRDCNQTLTDELIQIAIDKALGGGNG